MRVGYAGPVAFDMLRPYLHPEHRRAYAGSRYPQGSLLVGRLIDLGHHVSVFALDHEQGAEQPLELRGDRLEVFLLPYRARFRWIDAFRAERRALVEAIARAEVDVVHAQWSYEYALAAMASGKPHVVTVRDWAPLVLRMQRRPMEYVYRLVRWGMNRRVLRGAQRLTAASPYMLELLREHVGRAADLVPNALPDHVFVDEPSPPAARDPVIVSVNNGFGSRKNVATLIEAFHRVVEDAPEARLVLIGAGYGPDGAAASWAKERGLERGVTFLGPIPFERVLEEMRKAAVLAHPSREESFGGTLLEAMASGTPVIAGRNSGAVPWVLDGGRAGILIDVDDAGAMADAIASVLGDPDLSARLIAAGRERARAFDLDTTTRAYLDVYARVLEPSGSAGDARAAGRRGGAVGRGGPQR